ncbi:Dna-directed Rna polymerase II RPB11A [Cardiosporidium cionae]|uniref:Dna-directed Rna polymerase II RPB11A n=1 Tax=Cardiosporidium cionae TaxID=476202 RepID=A0ABQ7JE37_9APIC|nr:Dna-directed Rna polymerase II RPB11A [Cardiosporidium cionae]|eukprot:KAF8822165.1 Dna-directed Rna polymerase II RPB11A [Cardiosporidium cionae]
MATKSTSAVVMGRENTAQSNPIAATQMTFTLPNEDHTIGNAIRALLIRKPCVEFAGYSMPHPTLNEINLRIQTTGESAIDVLCEGLDDLSDICDHLSNLYHQQEKAVTTPLKSLKKSSLQKI